MHRIVFNAFGISWLDGLELFDNLSPNYCLVNKRLMHESNTAMAVNLESIHRHLISLQKNRKLIDIYMNDCEVLINRTPEHELTKKFIYYVNWHD